MVFLFASLLRDQKSVQLRDKPFAGLVMGESMVSGRWDHRCLSMFWSIKDSELVNLLRPSDLVGFRLGHRVGRYSVLQSLSIKIKFLWVFGVFIRLSLLE